MPEPDPDSMPVPGPVSMDPSPSAGPRPGTQASTPPGSQDIPELPYAEELQTMLEGRYIVESFLGQGGMGAVYKGLQMPLKRPVAIKILAKRAEGVEDDFSFEERFKREAYAMAALTHPNIVQVYDCGDAGESWLFISMELVEGGDLSDALKSGSVTPETALKLIPQICDGLQAAHERGIVHRDIKPANIFLTADGRAKVADFGLAKKFDVKGTLVTKTGLGMGTPDYAAPEQYEGVSDIDHRADIYSLGVMMYQMITGRLPRGAYKPASQRVAVDPRIDAVLAKAMEQDRAERYQSAADIKTDLQSIAVKPQAVQPVANTMTSAVPMAARPTTTGKQISKPVTRSPGATSPVPAAARGHTPAKVEKTKAGPKFIVIGSIAAAVIGIATMFALKRPTGVPAPEPSAAARTSSASSTAFPSDTTMASASVTQRAPVATALAKPGELLSFGGHRYQLIVERLPWSTANAKAEAMGGHLATITSEAENHWMKNNVARPPGDSHVFLGATRTNAFDAWTWVTGEPVDLSLWGGKGPDGSGGELAWLGNQWDDVGGNQSFMSLVEWDDDTARPAPALTGPVDLLAMTDLKRDAVKGEWQKTPDGLAVSNAPGPKLLGFNQSLSGEYDFEIEFTVREGQREVSQALPVPHGSMLWKMGVGGGDPAPFCLGPYLDEKNSQLDPTRSEALVRRARLKANQRYRSLVEVRKDSIRALIDGEEVLRWSGDLKRLANEYMFTLANPAHPGVGGYGTGIVFHKAEVRRASATPAVAGQHTVPPAAAMHSQAVTSPAKQEEGWINLIDTADVARDSLMVPWTIDNGVLKSPEDPKGPESPQAHTTFVFPIPNPPLNYDLRYRVTRDKGGASMLMAFRRGNESPCVSIDGGGGFTLRGTPTKHQEREWFHPGETHVVLLEVREEHLRVFHDGVVVVEHDGVLPGGQRESYFFPPQKMTGPVFAIGVCGGHITVHEAKFRPVDVVAQRKAAALAADPHLAQLDASFQSRLDADAVKPFKANVAALNQSYSMNGIARARAAAQSKGNAPEVTALDAEKANVEKGAGVPQEDAADTPAPVKALRNTYRTALAKLTAERDAKAAPLHDVYVKALDAYVIELTKSDKIADAQRARTLRNDIAQRKTGEPAPLANPPRSSAARAPTKLFDGSTLTGWRSQGPKDAFVVEDGCIKATGTRGNLMFEGIPNLPPLMKDFDLTMKVKTEGRANSGVFIHCPRNKDNASFSNALELQIANENSDPQKTGSAWGVKPVSELLVHDGEWFDYRILVRGMTVTTFINGKQVMEWTQPDDWKGAPGKPDAHLGEGTIGLQSNGGTVSFKDLELSAP